MIGYNPREWFWQIDGRDDYWSSAIGVFVNDLPEDSGLSHIGSAAELYDVLAVYGLPGPACPAAIDRERDRRITALFTFNSGSYQLDADSQRYITAKGAQAKFAVAAGAQPDDLRWANPDKDFGWIATDNSVMPMDAQTMAAFADAADLWVTAHIVAGHALKSMTPIPTDYADDKWWP